MLDMCSNSGVSGVFSLRAAGSPVWGRSPAKRAHVGLIGWESTTSLTFFEGSDGEESRFMESRKTRRLFAIDSEVSFAPHYWYRPGCGYGVERLLVT
jgi:hypothetical protein